jgi:7-cyano-7-deazaguanine synthase in queuosine biosynthesis
MNGPFVFLGHATQGNEITFHYRSGSIDFTEKLILSDVDFSKVPKELLQNLLDNLLFILGVSYWKLYCPKKIEVRDNLLTKEQAGFWNTVYTKGLGEFFYRNNIDFRGLVAFPYSKNHLSKAIAFPRTDRLLLMIGGGKDSIVSAEWLKENNKKFTAFVINDYPLQKEVIKILGVDSVVVKREIDQKLFALSKQQGTYNGHVPISAMYAFIALLVATLYDYRNIISSNEKSANYGNGEYLGLEINHQWSKSEEFETLFQNYVRNYLTQDINYFSILRPLSEIKIAQLFSKYQNYFSTFSSCNKNFTIRKSSDKKWCGQCSKCAFVFAALSAFLPKRRLIEIFGKNLYSDKALLGMYRELLGVKGSKPFECVGTPEEVKLAFYLAHKKGEFHGDGIMEMFEKEVLPAMNGTAQLEQKLLSGEMKIWN